MEIDESSVDNMTILRDDMISCLVSNTDIVFKSQQIGDPDLTNEEKRLIVEDCLNNKPLSFLTRFNRYMKQPHLEYFKRIHPECDYEVGFYIKENSARKAETVVKNRRLEAMKRLALEGDYFTEEEMRKRNPLLYEELVGKYLTEDEKKDKNSFSHAINNEEGCKLSSLLMEQFERDLAKDLKKEQEDAEEEIESDSDEPVQAQVDDMVLHLWGESNSPSNYIDISEKITKGEKKLLFEEFRSHMYRNFIGGKEADFDYSKVDTNDDYDDLDEIDRDAQDEYFASDTPEEVEMEVTEPLGLNGAQDSNILEGSPHHSQSNEEHLESSSVEMQPLCSSDNCHLTKPLNVSSVPSETGKSSGEDDPLDLYMAQLEEEQIQQQLNSKMKNTVIN